MRLATKRHALRQDTDHPEDTMPTATPTPDIHRQPSRAEAWHGAVGRRPRVVIVGAGFGGLSTARELRHAAMDVLVVDRNNYHGFWPFLYQVATGILETQEIGYPVREILRKQKNVGFGMAEVRCVDFDGRQVLTDRGSYPYDYLLLGGGSTTNYFGNDDLAEHSYGLKDVDDADRLRNHILTAFEAAAQTEDPDRRRALLTFVIVGGGSTGVELAGQLSILSRRTLRREFSNLDLDQTRIVLVNAGDSVLESFPEPLRDDARRRLEEMGAELRLDHRRVGRARNRSLRSGRTTRRGDRRLGGRRARVRPRQHAGHLRRPRRARPRYPATEPRDAARGLRRRRHGLPRGFNGDHPYPMVAQVAMQQGRQASKNIAALDKRGTPRSFRYSDRGQMAIVGRRSALVDGFGLRLDERLWVAPRDLVQSPVTGLDCLLEAVRRTHDILFADTSVPDSLKDQDSAANRAREVRSGASGVTCAE